MKRRHRHKKISALERLKRENARLSDFLQEQSEIHQHFVESSVEREKDVIKSVFDNLAIVLTVGGKGSKVYEAQVDVFPSQAEADAYIARQRTDDGGLYFQASACVQNATTVEIGTIITK